MKNRLLKISSSSNSIIIKHIRRRRVETESFLINELIQIITYKKPGLIRLILNSVIKALLFCVGMKLIMMDKADFAALFCLFCLALPVCFLYDNYKPPYRSDILEYKKAITDHISSLPAESLYSLFEYEENFTEFTTCTNIDWKALSKLFTNITPLGIQIERESCPVCSNRSVYYRVNEYYCSDCGVFFS